jgi:NDP-sugar pyrophosphorylase family protein
MINTIIPAAGKGSRFTSAGITTPKPLLIAGNKTLIEHSVDIVKDFSKNIFIITKDFATKEHNDQLSSIISRMSATEICVPGEEHHSGAAVSAKFAQECFIEENRLNDPLIIINSDQAMNWDYKKFLAFIEENDPDGVLILFKSTNPRNSFAKIENGKITEVVEKDPISDDALIGFHYWKRAEDFFNSAQKLMDDLYYTLHEPYVSETYNYLIKAGKTILPYHIDDKEFIPLGIPKDIENYLKLIK